MRDIIIKKKIGNFEIKSYSYNKDKDGGWLLKIDNDKVYIENFGKKYTIGLENLINITSHLRWKGDRDFYKAYYHIIEIEYLKKRKQNILV